MASSKCIVFYLHVIVSSTALRYTMLVLQSFNLQLENSGIDIAALSVPTHRRVFWAWLENWEKELLKKTHFVAETKLLEKYKDIVLFDPDMELLFRLRK